MLDDIVSLCKRRGFIFPGSDIYGGFAGTWDFGPLGVALKRKIEKEWWDFWVEKRDDIYGVDAAILMNPRTLVASGHTATFADPLVECKNCHGRFRADKIARGNFVSKGLSLLSDAKRKVWINRVDDVFIIRKNALSGLWTEIGDGLLD